MRYYAVIDTNVLVSALLKSASVPGTVLQMVFGGVIVPVFNERILREYKNVLLRQKFNFDVDEVDNVLTRLFDVGIYIEGKSIDIELPDEKDRVFYEVVMDIRTDVESYLVTGNLKHFPIEPFIVTPRQMLDIILADNNE